MQLLNTQFAFKTRKCSFFYCTYKTRPTVSQYLLNAALSTSHTNENTSESSNQWKPSLLLRLTEHVIKIISVTSKSTNGITQMPFTVHEATLFLECTHTLKGQIPAICPPSGSYDSERLLCKLNKTLGHSVQTHLGTLGWLDNKKNITRPRL